MNINNFDFLFNHISSSDLYYFYYNIDFLNNELFYLSENFYYKNLNYYNLDFTINNKLFNYYFWNTTYTFYKVLADYRSFHFKYSGKIIHGYGLSEFTRDYFWYIFHQRWFLTKITKAKLLYENILINEIDYIYMSNSWDLYNYKDIYAKLLHKLDQPVWGIETYNKNLFDFYYHIKDNKYLQNIKHLQDWMKVNWVISVIYPMLEFPEGTTVYWHRDISPGFNNKSIYYLEHIPISWSGDLYFLRDVFYDSFNFSFHSWLYLYLYNWQDFELRKINIFSVQTSITHILFMDLMDIFKIFLVIIIIVYILYLLANDIYIYWIITEIYREEKKEKIFKYIQFILNIKVINNYIRIIKIYFYLLRNKNIFLFLNYNFWIKIYFYFLRNNEIFYNKFTYKNLQKNYISMKKNIYIYIYIPLRDKYKFYEYYFLTYIDIFNFGPYLQIHAMLGNQVAGFWGSEERMKKLEDNPHSWWNKYPGAHLEYFKKHMSILLIESYSWSVLNWTGITFIRIIFIFINMILKIIKQYIFYNFYDLFSYKLIHFKLETLKFNMYYTYIYIYIYIVSKLNINKFLKLFSIHHYLHLEVATYTYDIINNNLLVIWNILNPFFKNSINYINPNIVYRRKLPINNVFLYIYKKIYPIILNYNYKNIKYNNIKILILIKMILLSIIIFIRLINKYLFISTFIRYFYLYKNINKFNNFYKKNKSLYKDLFFCLFFYLFFFKYITILFLFIFVLVFFIRDIIKDDVFYIFGYIYIFIFDLFINFINKIYCLFIYLIKFFMMFIFIYICYKFIIIYVCNDKYINFVLYNIKLDLMRFIIYYTDWFINYYRLYYIENFNDLNNFYNIIEEARQNAWDDIWDPFRNMWKQYLHIYSSFEWSIFSYENFMNKWLGSYKKEDIRLFVL